MDQSKAGLILPLMFIVGATVLMSSEVLAQPSTVVLALNTPNVDQYRTTTSNAVPQGNLSCVLISKQISFHHEPWPYLMAVLIILTVTFSASRIIRIARRWLITHEQLMVKADCKKGEYKGGFWDLIREGDYYPSLARFQFLIWTFTISITLLSIYSLMLWNHTLCWSALPQNILILMGISASVPIVSIVISKEKYMRDIDGTLPCKENIPALSTMLLEHSKPTIGRYQMFLWTIISVIMYLGLFLQQISGINSMDALMQVRLPDIDPSLLFLMGLSQAGYLGAKITARPVANLKIVGTYPTKNQRNVKRSTDIIVTFSESLDNTALNILTFGVRKQSDGSNVAGHVSVLAEDDKIAVFNPITDLDSNAKYDVSILKSIRSKEKRELENNETWSFQTRI